MGIQTFTPWASSPSAPHSLRVLETPLQKVERWAQQGEGLRPRSWKRGKDWWPTESGGGHGLQWDWGGAGWRAGWAGWEESVGAAGLDTGDPVENAWQQKEVGESQEPPET